MIVQAALSDEEACLVDEGNTVLDRMTVGEATDMKVVAATVWVVLDGETEQVAQLEDLVKLYKVEASRATKISIRCREVAAESSTIEVLLTS